MAEPFDSATYLEDVSGIVQTQYFPKFTEQTPQNMQMTTNKLFKPASEEITGDGKTLQVEIATGDSVRWGNDPLGAFPSPDRFQENTLRVRFNKSTLTSNDFSTVNASAQVDDIDLREGGKGSIIDFCDRIYRQVMPTYEYKLAIHRHIPKSGLVALVNGTPRQADNILFSSCTATPTNTTGLRVPVDNGSVACFRPGTRIDFVNASTGAVYAGNVRVTGYNPSDKSIRVEFNSAPATAAWTSTGNLANVVDNAQIYFSGEYNKGMYSLGAYFTRPAATGDSFIGGVDRQGKTYEWLNPTVTREGSTSARIAKSMFNDLAIAMGYVENDSSGMVFLSDPEINQALRDEIGEDAFVQIPVDDTRMKRFANFGSVGLNYQHSQFGMVKIMSDPLAVPNTVRVIAPETWRSLYYGWNGLQPLKSGSGHWYRVTAAEPNTGDSKIWKCDWYCNQMDFCFKPWQNGAILNVTSS